MQPAFPLLSDHPLQRGSAELLGFEAIADGLGDQLNATLEGGLLVGLRPRGPGAGLTSFLNLLHVSLVARGLPVIRLAGDVAPSLAPLLEVSPGVGLPTPIVLLDGTEPGLFEDLPSGRSGSAAVVAGWRPTSDAAEIARCRELSPVLVELPGWGRAAAARLAANLARSGEEERAWTDLLCLVDSPRVARRMVNAAGTAMACGSVEAVEVLTQLRDFLEGGTMSENVMGFAGAVDLGRLPAADEARTEPEDASEDSAPTEEPEGATTPRDAPDPSTLTPTASESAPSLRDDDDLQKRRRHCLELGMAGGDAAIRELVALLAEEHPAVRLSASHALAGLSDPSVAPAVRPMLSSPDASIRRGAAFVLGRLRDADSRVDLESLLDDSSPEVRRAASAALGNVGGNGAVRALLLALRDEHAGVRMAVESALSRVLSEQKPDALDAFLDDPDVECRRAALQAAGRLSFGTRQKLEALLEDEDEFAVEAAEALARRRESGSLLALARAAGKARADLRSAGLAAIARITGGPAAEGLAALLRSDQAEERDAAKAALARCPGAIEVLLPFVTSGEEAEDVQITATEALGRTGDRRAVTPLMDLHDTAAPPLRRAAASSLVRLGFEV